MEGAIAALLRTELYNMGAYHRNKAIAEERQVEMLLLGRNITESKGYRELNHQDL